MCFRHALGFGILPASLFQNTPCGVVHSAGQHVGQTSDALNSGWFQAALKKSNSSGGSLDVVSGLKFLQIRLAFALGAA